MSDSRWSKVKGWIILLDVHLIFLLRRKVASFTLRNWKGIIWSGEVIIVVIAFFLVRQFYVGEEWNIINIALTVLFGLTTLLGLIISITVLHIVRDTITDYTEAGEGLKKIILGAKQTLFILSENPAFLQVLHKDGLNTYYEVLRTRLLQGNLQRVVFAYVNRSKLINEKLPQWAKAGGVDACELVRELFSELAFNLGQIPKLKDKVFFVPLKTDSLPFFIAVADDDRMAMFCRQIIDDSDILRKSVFKGFVTFDPYITKALRSMYLKTLELDAIMYQYKCSKCGNVEEVSDHDLLQCGALNSENAADVEEIKCSSCKGESNKVDTTEVSSLELSHKNNYFTTVLGTEVE